MSKSSNYNRLEALWAQQQITCADVDYALWQKKKAQLHEMARWSNTCLFTVDVYRQHYNFASDSFADMLGMKHSRIRNIEKQGDFIEDYVHPDDRDEILVLQINHSHFIQSLPPERRNDFQTMYQYRIRNSHREYINVISRQQVLQKDRNGKAWIIMGMLDIAPDQTPASSVKHSVRDMITGQILQPSLYHSPQTSILSERETEILNMIGRGLLSKEIAAKLGISINTVNNHRKNILYKLKTDNSIEAINTAKAIGIIH